MFSTNSITQQIEVTNAPVQERIEVKLITKNHTTNLNGIYREWIPFFDLFHNTVGQNQSLSQNQSSLKNEPARLLSHLPATNANYEVAIHLFVRYNKRLITHTHLDAVFKFKPLSHESSDQIRKLVSVYVENTMALEALGMDIQASHFLWVYLITMKVDSETRRQWELHTTGDDVQTMASMRQFLEERSRALDFSVMSGISSRIVKGKSSDKEAQLRS